MQIDEFAAITQDVIRDEGFEEYQPTLCLPKRRTMRCLAGIPENERQEPIALRWAANLARSGEEYLVAFKHSAKEFKVVRFWRGNQEYRIYTVDT